MSQSYPADTGLRKRKIIHESDSKRKEKRKDGELFEASLIDGSAIHHSAGDRYIQYDSFHTRPGGTLPRSDDEARERG